MKAARSKSSSVFFERYIGLHTRCFFRLWFYILKVSLGQPPLIALTRAEAYREQTVAEAKGQASRFSQVYEQYKKAPDFAALIQIGQLPARFGFFTEPGNLAGRTRTSNQTIISR